MRDPPSSVHEDHASSIYTGATIFGDLEDPRALGDLTTALEATSVPSDARQAVVLQNDVWGLVARLEQGSVSDERVERLDEAARALLQRLTPEEIPPATVVLPDVVRRVAPQVVELGSEMPLLNHERLFGLRRIFRVAVSVDRSERVLFSQLVAIDRQGNAVLSDVIGEIEMLRFDGDRLVEAHVWHRDRESGALHPVDAVSHVPDLGADGFLFESPAPVPLSELPCAQCHDDDDMMSLPSPELAVQERWPALLRQVEVPSFQDG